MSTYEPTLAAVPVPRVRGRMVIAAFILLFVASAVPVALVTTPIMVDFFNHLGRIHVIAERQSDPFLAALYRIDWRIIPNLAMDAVVPLLARAVGTYAAGKIFVLATMALMLGGTVAVSAALERRLTFSPLVGFLFVYNWIFLYGFVNYLFGVGVALWGLAAWIHWRDRPAWQRGAISLLFCLVLFACHLYALGLYGVAIAAHEAWRLYRHPTTDRRRLARDLAVLLLPFVLILPLMAVSPTSEYAGETVWRLPEKIDGLYFVFKTYSAPADLLFAAVCAAAAGWALWTRRLQLHGTGWIFLLACIPLYLAMPTKLFGSGIADMRLPIAALFFVLGTARWRMRSPQGGALFAAAVAALALARFTLIGVYWHDYDLKLQALERSFPAIPRGSRVLVTGRYDPPPNYTYASMIEHMPCLVMIERSSLESLAFTHPGKQVLRVPAGYEAMALFEGEPPDIRALLDAEAGKRHIPDPAWRDWRNKFDYVYVLYGGYRALPPSNGLRMLYASADFQLYQIVR